MGSPTAALLNSTLAYLAASSLYARDCIHAGSRGWRYGTYASAAQHVSLSYGGWNSRVGSHHSNVGPSPSSSAADHSQV